MCRTAANREGPVRTHVPHGWNRTTLGRCFSELYRYPTYYGIAYVKDGVPEVRGELIQDDGTLDGRPEEYRYVTEATAREFPRVRLEPGDFVMSVRGTMGKIALVPPRLRGAVITANLIRMQFDAERVSYRWAKHYLSSPGFRDALELASSATTIRTIQVPALCAIGLPLPPLPEQGRIAEILDTADEAIRGTEALVGKLKAMKAGLLDDLLTRGLDEHGHLRDPATHPEQFKDSPLGRVPKEWEIQRLERLCDRITDGSHQAVRTAPSGIPFLYVSCVRDVLTAVQNCGAGRLKFAALGE